MARAKPKTEETATEEVAQEEKAPKVRIVEPKDERITPKANSRKSIMFEAGRTEEGALFKDVAATMGTTESNIRQHLTQCHDVHGFGFKVEGGRYWITGEPTGTYEEQQEAKKQAKAAEQAAKEPAEEAGEEAGDSGFLE